MPVYMKQVPLSPNYPTPPHANITKIPVQEISILYLILAHSHPDFVIRLIDALNEVQHTFVVHVDLKHPEIREKLTILIAISGRENVFIMEEEFSCSVNWGGYSVVNATIQGMKYAWTLDRTFHYLQLLSGTSYPIKSNEMIRTELSSQPGGIYMDVFHEPSLPYDTMWFHYVECDDRLHRIHRLSVLRGKYCTIDFI